MHALFHYILSSFCVFFEVITDFCMPAHNDLRHSTMCNFFFFFFLHTGLVLQGDSAGF